MSQALSTEHFPIPVKVENSHTSPVPVEIKNHGLKVLVEEKIEVYEREEYFSECKTDFDGGTDANRISVGGDDNSYMIEFISASVSSEGTGRGVFIKFIGGPQLDLPINPLNVKVLIKKQQRVEIGVNLGGSGARSTCYVTWKKLK